MFQELTEKPWCWNQTRAEMSRGWPTQSWRRFVAFVLRPVERLKGLSKGVTREKKNPPAFWNKNPWFGVESKGCGDHLENHYRKL